LEVQTTGRRKDGAAFHGGEGLGEASVLGLTGKRKREIEAARGKRNRWGHKLGDDNRWVDDELTFCGPCKKTKKGTTGGVRGEKTSESKGMAWKSRVASIYIQRKKPHWRGSEKRKDGVAGGRILAQKRRKGPIKNQETSRVKTTKGGLGRKHHCAPPPV